MLKVKKVRLVKLLKAAGVKGVDDMNEKKLAKAINALPKVIADEDNELNEKQLELAKAIMKADKKGKWTIVDEEAEAEEKVKAKSKSKHTAPDIGSPRGKFGIIDYVKEMLQNASKKKPLLFTDALKAVVKKFGPKTEADRPLPGLKTTVYSQLMVQLKQKGWDVQRVTDEELGNAFYIGKGGVPSESKEKTKTKGKSKEKEVVKKKKKAA